MYYFFLNNCKKNLFWHKFFFTFAVQKNIKPLVDLFSDIIKRCRQGDRKAQEAIYNLLAGKMFAVCIRYCANYEDARDLLHDGFVTVFTKIGQFKNAGSFEGWVRRIFLNHAVEWYRNSKRSFIAEKHCIKDYQCIQQGGENRI